MEKQKEGTTFPEEFVSRERTFSIHHVHFHAPHRRMYNTWHGKAVRIDADCGSFHSYQTPSTSSCASFHALLFSRIERETLSLSLSALSSATFLIKRPLRTVSSPPREKYQNSGSPSWFDRSNKFSSKSSRPTCDTELVVAVTAIARGVSKLSRYFALIHPRAAPRSSKQEHRSPRSLNGVLFL